MICSTVLLLYMTHLQVAREQVPNEVHGPPLEGLGQHGVVGVGEAALRDGPRLAATPASPRPAAAA